MKSKTNAVCARLALIMLCTTLGACGALGKQDRGYGLGPQAEQQAALDRTSRENALPDSPGMYLALIDKMQSEGMYYASLAHIDAYEKRYGTSPESTLRRADALRQTDQAAASRTAYEALLKTKLAARGYRGLGLLSGQSGNFEDAAQQFRQASDLEPTDALILSDLGYALLRAGTVDEARVPLMKASELARGNVKIQKNVVLYLLSSGQTDLAQEIIAREKFSADTQHALDASVKQVQDAAKARASASKVEAVAGATQEAPSAQEHSTWRHLLDAAKSFAASGNRESVAAVNTSP